MSQSYFTRIIDEAVAAIETRTRSGHVYTSSSELDEEIHDWFRRRWPQLDVSTNRDENQLKDPSWWSTFHQHFGARVPGITDMCVMQLNVFRPLQGGNIRLVGKGVWLAIERI
jgi:hypothetical protein